MGYRGDQSTENMLEYAHNLALKTARNAIKYMKNEIADSVQDDGETLNLSTVNEVYNKFESIIEYIDVFTVLDCDKEFILLCDEADDLDTAYDESQDEITKYDEIKEQFNDLLLEIDKSSSYDSIEEKAQLIDDIAWRLTKEYKDI